MASSYGKEHYWSYSQIERTKFERWMDWELSELQPWFIELFWSYYRTPDNERGEEKINSAMKHCKRYVQILDAHLAKNEFVSGPKFGLGDICVGACFYRYFNMGLEVERPTRVMEWYEWLSKRTTYQKVIQVPFGELKGRLTF